MCERNSVPDGSVVITLEEYADLLSDSQTLYFFMNGIMDRASLSYSGEYLNFEDSSIRTLLMASPFADRYRRRLEKLQKKKEKEEQDAARVNTD